MDVTVLGCRAGMPAEGQASSGYLVGGGVRLLLDCGPGVAVALSGVARVEELDGVVISHLHLDHCYDLLPVGKMVLSGAMRYPVAGVAAETGVRVARVPLYVPEGGGDVLRRLAALFPVSTMPALDRAFELAFDVREYRPGDVFAVGAAEVRLELLAHAAPNCGVRVRCGGETLAYTGDTGRTPALRALADGADLLLAECTLTEPDTGPHGHLCADDAGEAAAGAGVGRLVLTHFGSADPAWLEASRRRAAVRFGGPVHLAAPGARFPVRAGR